MYSPLHGKNALIRKRPQTSTEMIKIPSNGSDLKLPPTLGTGNWRFVINGSARISIRLDGAGETIIIIISPTHASS
jgi:hypothetical protein